MIRTALPLLFLLGASTACGPSPGLESKRGHPADSPVIQSQVCLSNFLDQAQVDEIDLELRPASEAPIEVRAMSLTLALHARVGSEKALKILESGLLTEWLVQVTPGRRVQNLCKPRTE